MEASYSEFWSRISNFGDAVHSLSRSHMKILLLEPFMGESHRAWAEGYARHSAHEVEIFGLAGRHWKWRMHGAAETFARQYRAQHCKPDLILATDMLDLAGFLAQTRDLTAHLPVALYFHENQLAYPWSPDDNDPKLQRDLHYGYINYRSALVADAVFWNSKYNLESFLDRLGPFLEAFPDHQELRNVQRIKAKSSVLPLGMEFPSSDIALKKPHPDGPLLLWNHRWEYDKGPDLFFETLIQLAAEGVPFRLAVLGRAYQKTPPIFERARIELGNRIVQWGFLEDGREYNRLLQASDLLPVTSSQDFFGASVVEAMHAGCVPLLPNALAYPQHVPEAHHAQLLYASKVEFKQKLRNLIKSIGQQEFNPRDWVSEYDWKLLAPVYDAIFSSVWLEKRARHSSSI